MPGSARHALFASLCLVGLLPSASVCAQVNAESLQADLFREGVSGGLEGSLALARGNVELLDVGGAGRIQYQTLHPLDAPEAPAEPSPDAADAPSASDPSESPLPFMAQRVFLSASARFAQRGESPFLSQAFAHARWTGMWDPRVGTDVFAQVQFNEFLHLQVRALAGAGVRVDAIHEREVMLWGGSGYMFEYDAIRVSPMASDAPETFEHRWTNYLTLRVAFFDAQLLVQNTLYYQPRFDDFEDFRFLEELEVMARVVPSFMLGITLSVLYDSAPPTDVANADLRLVTVLRLSF